MDNSWTTTKVWHFSGFSYLCDYTFSAFMKKLLLLPILLVILGACHRHRPIDDFFPWPESGSPTVDSLTLELERSIARGRLFDNYLGQLESLKAYSDSHPDDDMARMRYSYYRAWCHVNDGETQQWRPLYESALSAIDSASDTYLLYKWHQLYAHAEKNLFKSYMRSVDNYNYFDRIGDDYEKCRSAICIGNMHAELKDTANALFYYNQAKEIAEKTQLENVIWATNTNICRYLDSAAAVDMCSRMLAMPLVRRSPHRKALVMQRLFVITLDVNYLDSIIAHNRLIVPQNRILPTAYYNKGEYLLGKGETDSAAKYYKLAAQAVYPQYSGSDTILIQYRRAEVYEYEGKLDSAVAGLQKAFFSLNSAAERSHIADVYSLEARTRIDLIKRNHRLNRIRTITAVSLIVLFIVAGSLVVAMHYRRRATEKKLKSDLYAERLAHSREAMALRQMVIDEKNALITEIESVIDATRKPGLNDDPTIAGVSRALQSHKGNEAGRETMMNVKDGVEPEIVESLRRDFPMLTAGQLKMASMIIIGADNSLIARTLNISAESVWKGRYRLRQRLGLDNSVKLEDYLRDYARSHRSRL